MLDLIFLIFLIITLIFAVRGEYNETLCNIAAVVGVLAAAVGFTVIFLQGTARNPVPAFLRIFEFVFAVVLRYAARHIVKLYKDKEAENERKLNESLKRYTREDPNAAAVYNDDNFDDPEIRFGKGGYTDSDLK